MANPSEVFHHSVTPREHRTRGYIKRWHKSATAVEAARLRIRSQRAAADTTPSETPGFATPQLHALCHHLLSHKARQSACNMLLLQMCEKYMKSETDFHTEDCASTALVNTPHFTLPLFREQNMIQYNFINVTKSQELSNYQ
jgi:hypothetical protein